MAAGDTFRAAAAEQLGAWAERAGVELVRGDAGGDPSAVIYDGIERAAAKDIDLVLADTAGRLHTKTNLMDELRKVRRVADKGVGRVTETLLVIDATTGQNGLAQAREFGEATQVTGVVLTKLDGSAKGGIVFAIETELGIPIKLVGVGESIGDLMAFEPTEFVAGLFEQLTYELGPWREPPRVGRRPRNMRTARMRNPLVPLSVCAILMLAACGSDESVSPSTDPALQPPVAVNVVGSGGGNAEASSMEVAQDASASGPTATAAWG